jgi:ABC-type lipoprotein release transport system permease subunit
VLSEKKFLNETKNHNPPPSPFKLNGRSFTFVCKYWQNKHGEWARAFAYLENKYTFILIIMILIAIDSQIFKDLKK